LGRHVAAVLAVESMSRSRKRGPERRG
jgi:hypothetical protein